MAKQCFCEKRPDRGHWHSVAIPGMIIFNPIDKGQGPDKVEEQAKERNENG